RPANAVRHMRNPPPAGEEHLALALPVVYAWPVLRSEVLDVLGLPADRREALRRRGGRRRPQRRRAGPGRRAAAPRRGPAPAADRPLPGRGPPRPGTDRPVRHDPRGREVHLVVVRCPYPVATSSWVTTSTRVTRRTASCRSTRCA